MPSFHHQTVLRHELISYLQIKAGQTVIDCTAGGGGHTELCLQAVGPQGKVFAIDRDKFAIAHLEAKFKAALLAQNLSLHHMPFSQLDRLTSAGSIDAIAADLGVSSPQLDDQERGFSFMKDGPLDMRMSPDSSAPSAAELLANLEAEELAQIFYRYGEEPRARAIAQAIIKYRQKEAIVRTGQLANLVAQAAAYRSPSKKHPATRVFQALRIYVNDELQEISLMLSKAFALLKPGGRLGVITFHSLEDRIVKQFCKNLAGQGAPLLPRGLPMTVQELEALQKVQARIIKPFPLYPSDVEIAANPRARSAKLRLLEKGPANSLP